MVVNFRQALRESNDGSCCKKGNRYVMIAKHHDIQISSGYHILVRPWAGARAPGRCTTVRALRGLKRVDAICSVKCEFGPHHKITILPPNITTSKADPPYPASDAAGLRRRRTVARPQAEAPARHGDTPISCADLGRPACREARAAPPIHM